MKLFISHSSKDKSEFDNLCLNLARSGIVCWNRDSMLSGTYLSDELRGAITECPVCVFIATENSLGSGRCQVELGPFWGADKTVIIYLADSNITIESLPKQF